MDPPVGSIVTIPQGRGVVRFSGTTDFAPGKWIGIELYEPNGKNDGSINGVVYFSCKMNYGVFVRQSQIKNIHGMEIDNTASTSTVNTINPTILNSLTTIVSSDRHQVPLLQQHVHRATNAPIVAVCSVQAHFDQVQHQQALPPKHPLPVPKVQPDYHKPFLKQRPYPTRSPEPMPLLQPNAPRISVFSLVDPLLCASRLARMFPQVLDQIRQVRCIPRCQPLLPRPLRLV